MPGPSTALALEAIEALTTVYGAALGRAVAAVAAGGASVDGLARDELVGHLMVLHGLHPDSTETRVARALQEVGPQLGEGTHVELKDIHDGIAEVAVTATGCASTASAIASSLGDVVLAAAPELAGVEPVVTKPPAQPALIPVDSLLRKSVAG